MVRTQPRMPWGLALSRLCPEDSCGSPPAWDPRLNPHTPLSEALTSLHQVVPSGPWALAQSQSLSREMWRSPQSELTCRGVVGSGTRPSLTKTQEMPGLQPGRRGRGAPAECPSGVEKRQPGHDGVSCPRHSLPWIWGPALPSCCAAKSRMSGAFSTWVLLRL